MNDQPGGQPFSKMLRDGGSPRPGAWEAAERALDADYPPEPTEGDDDE